MEKYMTWGEVAFGIVLGFTIVGFILFLLIGPKNFFRKKVVLGERVILVKDYDPKQYIEKDDHEKIVIYAKLLLTENTELLEDIQDQQEFIEWFQKNITAIVNNYSFQTQQMLILTKVDEVMKNLERDLKEDFLLQYS